MGETINHIHRVWLPHSGFRRADGPDLERYDHRCNDSDSSEFDYLVPVTKK